MKVRDYVEVAIDAAIAAALRYQTMSGGSTVHEHAIETFISSKVAEAIFDRASSPRTAVALEMSFGEAERLSQAKLRGRRKASLSPRNRFDVVVLSDKRPIGLIEIKKRFSVGRLDKDVIRLSDAVDKYGSGNEGTVRFGLALSVQRVFENSRSDAEAAIKHFRSGFHWAIEPEITYRPHDGDFNVAKNGRKVTGICAFAVLFDPGSNR